MVLIDYQRTSQHTKRSTSTTTTAVSANAYGYGKTTVTYGSAYSTATYNPGQTHTIIKPGVDVAVKSLEADGAEESGAPSIQQTYRRHTKKYGPE